MPVIPSVTESPAEILAFLQQQLTEKADPKNVAGMARFGICSKKAYGIAMPELREMAKPFRNNHELAKLLIKAGSHETRIMACFVGEPKKVTPEEMDEWVLWLENWADADSLCGNLWDKTPFAAQKVHEWSQRPEEIVKRCAFSLIAWLAVHNKKAPDSYYAQFYPVLLREASDNRNFVKKALNWALRSIGKRNANLLVEATRLAEEIQATGTPSARWIAADALREFSLVERKQAQKQQAESLTRF